MNPMQIIVLRLAQEEESKRPFVGSLAYPGSMLSTLTTASLLRDSARA